MSSEIAPGFDPIDLQPVDEITITTLVDGDATDDGVAIPVSITIASGCAPAR